MSFFPKEMIWIHHQTSNKKRIPENNHPIKIPIEGKIPKDHLKKSPKPKKNSVKNAKCVIYYVLFCNKVIKMLSKILRLNQNFISTILFALWLGFFLMINRAIDVQLNAGLSLCLFTGSTGVALVYAQRINFLKETHFFAFYYLVFILFFSCCLTDLAFFAGCLFLNVVLFQVLNEHDVFEKILSPYDMGFFAGVAIILYPPFWVFGVFLLLHYTTLGKIQLRGLLLAILGLMTVGLISAELLVLFDATDLFPIILGKFHLSPIAEISWNSLWLLPVLGIVGYGIVDYLLNINKQMVEKKIIFFNIAILLLFSAVFLFFYGGETENVWLVLALPIALLLANVSLYTKPIWVEVMLWVFLLSIVLFKYARFIELPGVLRDISF